jgi:hypothetical protein
MRGNARDVGFCVISVGLPRKRIRKRDFSNRTVVRKPAAKIRQARFKRLMGAHDKTRLTYSGKPGFGHGA